MPERWRVEMLGGLRAVHGQRVVSRFESRKVAALLAYLAFHPGQAIARETLLEVLWPEEDPDATRPRLRQTLAGLRRALEHPGVPPGSVVDADRTTIRLRPESFDTDVDAFRALIASAASTGQAETRLALLTQAAAGYGGDLLPGYYEDWVSPQRERLADARLLVLSDLSGLVALRGELGRAIDYARQAVAADPFREHLHQNLMRLYVEAGRPADAVRQFRDLERILRTELNSQPGRESRDLIASIHRRPDEDSVAAAHDGATGARKASHEPSSEPPGGAVPLNSPFYVERTADKPFHSAIRRVDSIVLVKGPRQVGKTSLLARGFETARRAGYRVLLTDLQATTTEQLSSADALFLSLAQSMAIDLDLAEAPETAWDPRRGWNVNFQRYLQREVLNADLPPLIWGLDEVDRLFGLPYSNEVFGLFRSWHNARALHPNGPWSRLTLAMAYATEAHLFITDLNQSPFNVGTRITLEDFTPEAVNDLNHRHGLPLTDARQMARFLDLVGGHPYLVRAGLYELGARGIDLTTLEAEARREDGVFGTHLRRLLQSLSRDGALCEAVVGVLRGDSPPSPDAFFRLQSAGVLIGESPEGSRLRCGLYREYLERHLRAE